MTLEQLDENPDWETSLENPPPGWEPWEGDDEPSAEPIGCHYCDSPDTRIDPFAGKPCCEECFLDLIGDDQPRGEREPWKCGTEVER